MSPCEFLDLATILEQLSQPVRHSLNQLIIRPSVDSTNSAIQRLPAEEQHKVALLAEQQTAGRGRRGNQWHSPVGGNLYLSLGWCFEKPVSALGSLPLVVALSAAEALSRCGIKGHQLKWPNDLLLDGRKLAGCLVEVQSDRQSAGQGDRQGDGQGPCRAVIGLGINIRMPTNKGIDSIDQPWIDLSQHSPNCSRNTLAAFLLESLFTQLDVFATQGFKPFIQQWNGMDALAGQHITLQSGLQTLNGTMKGIDETGALLLDTGSHLQTIHSADTIRRTAPS